VALPSEQKIALQLGRALARERANNGQTQEQVAELLGVTPETIGRMERGTVLPTLPRLLALADVYDVPVSRLLGRSSVRAPDIAEKVADQLGRLSENDRMWVGHWLDELCDRLAATMKTHPRAGKQHR
jgi:transcriptional regulator with XRE-family HTH domain